jgi:hypothetical protein
MDSASPHVFVPPADSKERHISASPLPTGASRRSSTSAVVISKALPSSTDMTSSEDLAPLLTPNQMAEEKEKSEMAAAAATAGVGVSEKGGADKKDTKETSNLPDRSLTPVHSIISASKLSPVKEVC